MSITKQQRQAILRTARSYLGVAYDDAHGDMAWKDLGTTPRALDCSGLVCRVAMEALGSTQLLPDAGWLIDNLIEVASPEPGDLVGYGRSGTQAESSGGYHAVWHVMLYAGSGRVIGACDLASKVVERPFDYELSLGMRQWRCVGVPPAPYRRLELRRRTP